jgi:Cu+-exporting ATPase
LNDAGALKASYAGIAISEDTGKFTPASDAILDARELKHLNKFLRFSKTGMSIIKASFIFSLVYNIIALSLAVQGVFSPVISAILMPISSVSLVVFATLSVRVSAYFKGF